MSSDVPLLDPDHRVRLTPAERRRVIRKLNALQRALLEHHRRVGAASGELLSDKAFVPHARARAKAFFLYASDVARLKRLFAAYGVA